MTAATFFAGIVLALAVGAAIGALWERSRPARGRGRRTAGKTDPRGRIAAPAHARGIRAAACLPPPGDGGAVARFAVSGSARPLGRADPPPRRRTGWHGSLLRFY